MTILTLAMTAVSLSVTFTSAQTSDNATQDMSWQGQGSVLLDAIYYDELSRNQQRRNLAADLDQGAQAQAWTAENAVAVQPMVYNGGVDWYGDNEYSDDDRLRFKNWIDENIPADYTGPICLDMEGDWWSQFDTSSQVAMDVIIDFYIEGLEYAQSLRPNAKIGYWGLPKKSHTKVDSTTASVVRLLQASTAIFPDVYDFNAVANGSARLQRRIEKSIEMVEGKVPVYVQASPRYKLQGGQYDRLHTVEEFMRDQVDSSLAAVWTDAEGTEHRIAGIALWDAYVYFWWYTNNWTSLGQDTQRAMWDELDAYHVELLTEMKVSVDAANAAAVARNEAASEEVATRVAVELDAQVQTETADQAKTTCKQLSVQSVKAISKSSRTSRATWNNAKATWKAASLNRG